MQSLSGLFLRRICTGLALFALCLSAAAEEGSWQSRYQQADWVARLRIEGVANLINPAMSRNQALAVQGRRYNALVLHKWKGEAEGPIRFQVDLGDCAELLEVDTQYIVFGSRNFRGELQAFSCEDLISVAEAQELPALLDELNSATRGHRQTSVTVDFARAPLAMHNQTAQPAM